jgi:hypothetical protein
MALHTNRYSVPVAGLAGRSRCAKARTTSRSSFTDIHNDAIANRPDSLKRGSQQEDLQGDDGTPGADSHRRSEEDRSFVVPGIERHVRVDRKARMRHNPATGETIKIPAKRIVKFRVAKAAKEATVPTKAKETLA